MGKLKFKPNIPNGWETYTTGFQVAAVGIYRDNAKVAFENNPMPIIALEREPDNEYDSNAIMVSVPKSIKLLWILNYKTELQVGYIPATLAKLMVRYDLDQIVKARIRTLYVDDKGYVNCVIIDLIGPSKHYDDRIKKAIDRCEF